MKTILGKPLLELLIERLHRASRIDEIWIATTSHSADDVVEELAHRLGVGCFRGSEDDVLDRVLRTARRSAADVIVEITGDCPLIDPSVIDELVATYLNNEYDYVSNVLYRTFPRGLDTQVFATSVLEEVGRSTVDAADREHVSLYIYEHPERFSLHNLDSGLPEKYWGLRLTVDTPEDFTLIKAIFEALYPTNPAFRLRDVLSLLDQRPELVELNKHISQKPVR